MEHVGVSGFTERRLARLGGGAEAALLFPPQYSHPVPSPDGTLLAYLCDRDGRPRAWVAPMPPAGKPVVEPERPLPAAGDVEAVTWSPDGQWLACQTAPSGSERTRVHVVSPDGAQEFELAPGAAAVRLGTWSPTGRQLGVTIFAAGTGDGQACLVDLRDGTSTALAAGPAALVCAVSGDGRRAVVRLGPHGAHRLELVDLHSGRRTELLPGGATVADAHFGVTGRQLYVHTDAGRERPALLAVTVRGGSVSTVYPVAERPDDDLDLVALDPTGARAALGWNVDGRSEAELLDLRSGLLEPVVPVPGDVITDAAFTRDGNALLVANEGATVSPQVSRIGLDVHGTATPLLRASRRFGTTLVEPTLHDLRAEDGLRLSGWLLRPSGALGPLPTLIWLHGPQTQERPTFQPLFQALLAEGVAVFAPNVRGSSGYGRGFTAAADGDRRFAAINDVRSVADFLVSAGLADPGRIGVAGRSDGGYLALAALAWFPDLFAVGVDVSGISDLASFHARTEAWIATASSGTYGDPAADAMLLRELSPLHRADGITTPLLVVHGAHDTHVPLTEAQELVDALRERGANPGFLLLSDEGHEVRGTDNRVVFVREVVSWVTTHLAGIGERTA